MAIAVGRAAEFCGIGCSKMAELYTRLFVISHTHELHASPRFPCGTCTRVRTMFVHTQLYTAVHRTVHFTKGANLRKKMASPTPAPPPAGASCAVPLARIVSQEVAALYSISECREQWQRLRGSVRLMLLWNLHPLHKLNPRKSSSPPTNQVPNMVSQTGR